MNSNIGLICSKHAKERHAKTQEEIKDIDPELFIGRHVKIEFFSNEGKSEHMWVYVDCSENGELCGKLDNIPLYCDHLKLGMFVTFRKEQIEEIC